MDVRTALVTAVLFIAAVTPAANPDPLPGDTTRAAISGATVTPQAGSGPNRFAPTPQRLRRGEYVATVTGCFRCHSERDWNSPGAPPIEAKKGAGTLFAVGAGPVDPHKPPPQVYAPNITPDPETGVGRWSDEQLERSIRQSVDRDAHSFPPSFHTGPRNLSDNDVASVIAYLRTIPAVHNPAPATSPPSPKPPAATPPPAMISVPEPVLIDAQHRGEYLVAIADCVSCHTTPQEGAPLRGKKFSGGKMMSDSPEHYVVSPNITMDASGIGYYDQAMFIRVLRTGKVGARKLYPIMPWGYFSKMSNQDLKAVFVYLKSQPHVQHRVDNSEPPTFCRRCLHRHGAGDRN